MTALPLKSGAYYSAALIANAQRCVNMFPERNPEETDPKFPTVHFARPGLTKLGAPASNGFGRGLFTATNGDLYAVISQTLYYIDRNWTFTAIGTLLTNQLTPVSMVDNGTTIVLVDGSPQGYQIDLIARTMIQISDPTFVGSTRADFIDTFIIFNIPNTNKWYCTLSGQVAFNALYIGVKTAWPDNILCVVAIEREVWVFGPQKTEVWYNAGTVPFPFQLVPGVIIEHGCVAKYSPAKIDTSVFWLSQSPEGARMVMHGTSENVAKRISNHAIEDEFIQYPRVDDAVGSVYQIGGHSFYRLHFPTADKTWAFDLATGQWWEDNWIDNNGRFHRSIAPFTTYAYGVNLALDWVNGNLYKIDQRVYTDNGQPIPWIRSFPHFANELKYVGQAAIVADAETGTRPGTGETAVLLSPWSSGFSSGFGPLAVIPVPTINLRISRDGGYSFGTLRPKAMASSGRYRSMMRWRGNGLARDWVVEISSTAEMCGALNGVYIDPIGAGA